MKSINIPIASLSIALALGAGSLATALPASADDAAMSARSMAETRFLSGLKTWEGTLDDFPEVDLSRAENYDKHVLILPGGSYHIPNVNASTYYIDNDRGDVEQLFDADYPLESLANMFLLPIEEARETEIDLTVLTHDYGSSQRISTTVDRLISYCEAAGCQPFFGVEKMEGDNVECALFLFNRRGGYDHVLKISCNAREVIEQQATITGRLSLFVPTNNVSTLFQEMPRGKSGAGRYIEREGVEYDD